MREKGRGGKESKTAPPSVPPYAPGIYPSFISLNAPQKVLGNLNAKYVWHSVTTAKSYLKILNTFIWAEVKRISFTWWHFAIALAIFV